MAHDEEVEDLGDLDDTLPDSTLPEASGVELAPPSDAGKGPLATPAPTVPTGAGEDPTPAPALTGEDASKAMGEPAAEDPTAAARPSQVAEYGLGILSVNFCLCDTEPRLLRRFRRLGLRKQPLLTILILWRPQP
jgi:hypothetical protein